MKDIDLPKLPLDTLAIQQCIPHRYPFLLIDRIVELVPHQRIVAIKNVSIADPILQGHFPQSPVYPGVLIIEGLAQASAVLGHFSRSEGFHQVLLTEVSKARFKFKVEPGDTLHYEIKVEKQRSPFFWFEGVAKVGDQVVASSHFSALMK